MDNQAEDRTPIRVPVPWEKETQDYSTFTLLRDLVLTANRQAQQIEELRFRLDRAEMLLKDIAATVEELAEWKAEREAEAFLAESVAIWGSGEPHG